MSAGDKIKIPTRFIKRFVPGGLEFNQIHDAIQKFNSQDCFIKQYCEDIQAVFKQLLVSRDGSPTCIPPLLLKILFETFISWKPKRSDFQVKLIFYQPIWLGNNTDFS